MGQPWEGGMKNTFEFRETLFFAELGLCGVLDRKYDGNGFYEQYDILVA